MTPVFSCGLECGVDGGHVSLNGTSSLNTSTVRSGARSLRCNPTASTGFGRFLIPSSSRLVGRLYVRFATLPSANTTIIIAGAGGATSGPGIKFVSSDNSIRCFVDTTIAGSGVVVTTDQWYRIDFDIAINAGNDTSDARVDGTTLTQATASGTTGTVTNLDVGIQETCTADMFIDDFVLSNTGGDYPIGAGYVNHFIPTADGTHNIAGTGDFQRTLTGTDILNATTTAFQLVDDVPLESGAGTDWINMLAPPNATDYVECIFGPAAGISTPTVGPRAVEVIAGIRQFGTGNGNMEIRINDNGTMDAMYSATGVAGVTTIAFKRKHYATAIAGGGAWVIGGGGNGDFTDLRVRFGSPAALDVNPDQYFTGIMIEAEFEELASFIPDPRRQMHQILAQ